MWKNGYAILRGVEIEGCGQFNTTESALRIENVNVNTNATSKKTVVENSAIHNCRGNCAFLNQAKNISMANNLFFHSKGSMVFVDKSVTEFNFYSNLLVGVTKLDSGDNAQPNENVFGLVHMAVSDFSVLDSVNISNNLLQGSQGVGFLLPATNCSRI